MVTGSGDGADGFGIHNAEAVLQRPQRTERRQTRGDGLNVGVDCSAANDGQRLVGLFDGLGSDFPVLPKREKVRARS